MRLNGLTGTRALAAGAVMLHHYLPGADDRLRGVAHLGYLGVAYFFALSGFVLTYNARPTTAGDFYRRRFARIYPTHLVALLLALIVIEHSAGPAVANVLLVQGWVPDSDWYFGGNVVAWSLCSEAFFYALTPWLLLRVTRCRLPLLVGLLGGFAVVQAVMTVALPVDVRLWTGYIVPLAGLPIFVAGMLIARGVRDETLPTIPLRLAGTAVATSMGLAFVVQEVLARSGRDDPAGRGALIALVLPSFLAAIVALAQQERQGGRTWFAAPPWVRLGEWSFAFYLVHTTVLHIVTGNGTRTGWAWAGVALAAAIVLAAALHHGVEHPMEKRLRPRRVVEPVAREAHQT